MLKIMMTIVKQNKDDNYNHDYDIDGKFNNIFYC